MKKLIYFSLFAFVAYLAYEIYTNKKASDLERSYHLQILDLNKRTFSELSDKIFSSNSINIQLTANSLIYKSVLDAESTVEKTKMLVAKAEDNPLTNLTTEKELRYNQLDNREKELQQLKLFHKQIISMKPSRP